MFSYFSTKTYFVVLIRSASNEYPQCMFLSRNEGEALLMSTHNGWPQWLSWMHRPSGDQEVVGSTPAEVGSILSWRLIMKYIILSLPLIQEGQLSVSGERMCTILVNRLEG